MILIQQVAVKVYNDYKAATGDETKTIIASTASPYKFSGSVLEAIGINTDSDEFELVESLQKLQRFLFLHHWQNLRIRISDLKKLLIRLK